MGLYLAIPFALALFGPDVATIDVELKIKSGVCTETKPKFKDNKKIDKGDREIVLWRLKNRCGEDIEVYICGGPPRIGCVGDPGGPGGATFGSQFKLEAGTEEFVACTIDWPNSKYQKYPTYVITGPSGTTLQCPPKIESFELTIEPVP